MDLKELVLQEMDRIHQPNYYGSKTQIENEIKIMKLTNVEMTDDMAIEDWLYEVYHNEPNAKQEYK